MTHFKIEIFLPLYFNPDSSGHRIKIPDDLYLETYEELLAMVGGVTTTPNPLDGSWVNPMGRRFDDKNIAFFVIVEDEDKKTPFSVEKIKKLKEYKEKLKKRFQQEQIYMVAFPCVWL